ncbi:MAG TPA: DUF1549 domain-containing protein [Chthonomonadaceae bacterium]|nr:DUF1549 domain-containing protein [Chthonomonadaceae bacterium]
MRFGTFAAVAALVAIAALPAAAERPAAHAKSTPAKPAPVKALPTPPARVEFLRDVAPILDRGGCSSAGCHGKFGGRGGLQVSLLTLAPEDDYEPLIYGGRGRRVNFAVPEKSLLLLKATNTVPHAGGPRFAVGSPQYNTILRWLKAGAPFDDKDPRLAALSISPQKFTLPKVGVPRQVRVMATYTDGSTRDVTSQTAFQSTNDAVLSVNQSGVVTGLRWGGGAVLGRYLGTIVASFVTLPQARKGAYPAQPANNLIDKYVFDNLRSLNVLPSYLSTDTEFLRRVTLDTLGRLPTPDEISAFTANTDPQKRAKLIDDLLQRPEFADYRALRLADLLRVNPRKISNTGDLGERAATLFYEWIWKSVDANKPWDQFVREIVTARGSTFQNGPANFYRIERNPNDRMENLGQAFLGVRMSCARCHKHPFDRWTTDDYWNFAAFMGKVGVRGNRVLDDNVIDYNAGAQVINASVTGRNRGKVAPCTYLGERTPVKPEGDLIVQLADWMTAPTNTFFARATVNRLWSYYFGRGIIHPVDDMRATTPESVPGLLDALAKELVDSKYDAKHVIRLILNSRTYQLSAIPTDSNARDDRFFSHFLPKAMPAQAMLDMLNQATGAKEQFGSFPERTKAVQAAMPISNSFLNAFGESHRDFLADIDPKLEPNLVQTLMMINSPYVDNKVKSGNTVPGVLDHSDTDADVVKNLYLRTFNREPTALEISKAVPLIQQAKDRREGAQDLLWALVTSREFFFNH